MDYVGGSPSVGFTEVMSQARGKGMGLVRPVEGDDDLEWAVSQVGDQWLLEFEGFFHSSVRSGHS